MIRRPPRERFDALCAPPTPTGCVLWLGKPSRKGYGRFWDGERNVAAHKWSWEQKNGPVPEGLQLDHFRCDTSLCVEPDHCRPVTSRENNLRSNCVSSISAAKTSCSSGHEYTPENTRVLPRGERVCKTCERERQRLYKQRHREVVNARQNAVRARTRIKN